MPTSAKASIEIGQLLDNQPLDILIGAAQDVTVSISNTYLKRMVIAEPPSEVFGLQRLVTLVNKCSKVSFIWQKEVIAIVAHTPSLHPLLATALCLESVIHETNSESNSLEVFTAARSQVLNYRLKIDAFMDSQVLICADNLGKSKHPDLYNLNTGKILSIETIGVILEDLIIQQIATGAELSNTYNYSTQLGAIVFELFENTELHGKLNIKGNPIKNSIRGIIIKRVKKTPIPAIGKTEKNIPQIDCIEISIFDSGIGYYSGYTKETLTTETSIKDEWKILHTCLKTHFNDSEYEKNEPGHRGMGLYEVLRALKRINGFIEIRTGRVHGYQTFFLGESRLQVEPLTSDTRPGMPKPTLLDVARKFLTVPTQHEHLTGTSVRILVPLK